ncbi:LPXTG-motif cell wall-anchored protein [Streptomyces glaucescens]|jgi:LPXTG-motif cell wall-anchored protein
MKLRRAMAAAAATAAIAPLALLAAPAAFASDEPSASPSVTATETVSESATPSPTTSTGETTPDPTNSATESAPAPTGSASDSAPAPTGSATESAPEPTGSTSASPSPSASESTDPEPDFCADPDDDSMGLSEDLSSGLSGLADTIVAGSGWEEFSFDVSNSGDDEIKDIVPLIGVAAIGWDEQDYSGEIAVQVYDKANGWQTIAGAAGEGGTFPAFSLGAGQSVSFPMRLSVSGDVPDAIGLTGGFAQYSDDEGCWLADDPNGWIYEFAILEAGSEAPDPGEAKPKPQGGMSDLDEVSQVEATGSLAETGSNSALPMIGLVGGLAVVAGAGAVYVVRRKKAEA